VWCLCAFFITPLQIERDRERERERWGESERRRERERDLVISSLTKPHHMFKCRSRCSTHILRKKYVKSKAKNNFKKQRTNNGVKQQRCDSAT
jgi:hypothetical protein